MFRVNKMYLAAVFTAFFVAMAFGVVPAQAAPAASTGVVDYLYLINQQPETAQANATLRSEQEAAKKEFADKSSGLSDADKQNLDRQLGQRVEQKRQELLQPIIEKINAAIKEVADAKGLSVVIAKQQVIYGGVDITEDVLKKITGK